MQKQEFFEKKRIELLAARIRGDQGAAGVLLEAVSARVKENARLSEVEQKAINQMLTAEKKFDTGSDSNQREAFKRTRSRLKAALSRVVRTQVRNVEYVGYDRWLKTLGLGVDRYRTMLYNVATCQVTVGCSNFCRRCNEWALPGVRKHFSLDAAKQIVRDLSAEGNRSYTLYGASDPLDYRCNGKTIADLLNYMSAQGYSTEFGLLTKIPKGSTALAQRFLEEDADIAVSVTRQNRSKVATLEQKTGKKFNTHHEVDELLIPAGLDEDFATVKSSITDNYGIEITPEGAAIVIPTFTSALNPTGQHRIPITGNSGWFVKKRVGRKALPVEYFKPLAAQEGSGTGFVLDHLLDPQIENILLDNGSLELTPPGMMNLAEYFKTYAPEVVKHRKALAPVALENLRKSLLINSTNKTADYQKLEQACDRKARSYIDFCDIGKVRAFRQKAFSYLLAAVAGFLKTHRAEREVIRFLCRKEISAFQKRRGRIDRDGADSVEALLDDPGRGTFDFFRSLLFVLLDDPRDDRIHGFIESNPAGYDPDSGRFV